MGTTPTAPIQLGEIEEDLPKTSIMIQTHITLEMPGTMGKEEEHALKATLLNALKAIKEKLWNSSQLSKDS